MEAKKVVALEVVEIATGKVVETIPLQHHDERYVERVTRGLLINMDRDRFCVREKVEA